MNSKIPWGFLALELPQILVCLACLIINLLTLKDAMDTRRRIVASGMNHGADKWANIQVRGKSCLLAVQIFSAGMGIDRLVFLCDGYRPQMPVHYIGFGIARTAISVCVAITAWMNMRAFRELGS